MFATTDKISLHFASSESDAPSLSRQLRAFFPEVVFIERHDTVAEKWNDTDGDAFIVDFGLAHELMLPLETDHQVDPFVDLMGALSTLKTGEVAVFQVVFQPVRNSWGNSIWRSITDDSGKNLFINRPQLIVGTKEKVGAPFFGVTVRAAAKAAEFDDATGILRNVAFALRAFTRREGNRLIPLQNDEYPFEAHEEDLLKRLSRRSGMLLNGDELLGFVHFPADEVSSPKLKRQRVAAKAVPISVTGSDGLVLGSNEFAGVISEVRLSAEQRTRHVHIVGASGTGKSTLLFNLIQQDISRGQGVAVLDPHGDLVERVLGIIPPERIKDVVLLDPTDEEYSIGFNVLSAHSDFEKNLLASDLVSVFRRLSSSWGDQLNSVLNNAILAFLESERGGTLADLRRFLLDAGYRNEFLTTVRDPDIVYYWHKGFPQLGGNKSIGPVITRLDTFLSPKPIRHMVSQQVNRLDFADILDTGKIFLAKLPQGQIGKENSFLLGSLLVSKFQQLAMSRQRMSQDQRRDFWLYIDEFHYFITPSMAEILSGARKYRLGLVLAHHELHQLQRDPDVASAVMSHPYTRVVFRVGDTDANTLAKGFASFEARDLQNLEVGEAVCRVERSDFDFNLSIPLPVDPAPASASQTRSQVITASREKYATPRAEVEATLLRSAQSESPPPARKPRAETPPAVVAKQKPAFPVPFEVPLVEHHSPAKDVSEVAKPILRPSSEGIGGAQHQATQKRIKEAAEKLGFLAVIEKEIPNGSVDLWLQRNGFAIACEISVTTTIDHEFRNVRKCLEAEAAHVAVISGKPLRLDQIKNAADSGLGSDKTARVGYYSPDGFIAWLSTLTAPEPNPVTSEPTVTIRRGRKVTRKGPSLTPEELKQREAAQIALFSEVMRPKPR
ncbi:MAG TPA: type IV secretion system DNA-binding domain-containing protein [Candidatus Acidoferrum sp.]|nr:type IV secretion system DNA-binding domain-containing protein [Candidatus Acidoferrum sp.]